MPRYSQEFKYNIIKKMMPPENKSVSAISQETGLSEATLFKWKKEAKAKGFVITDGESSSEAWSSQDKFQIVLETAALNEAELAEYCRKKGLYVEQVEAWRNACHQANGGIAQEAARMHKALKEKDHEYKKLEKELNRKEKALAEAAALMILQKKGPSDLGGPRGRMISTSDRIQAIQLIDEAVKAGAREIKACRVLGIHTRTLRRWRHHQEDQRPLAERPAPANKLTIEEENAIMEVIHSPEYQSLPPSQIVPSLADLGMYLASESTIYRKLRERGMQHHRGRSQAPVKRPLPTHKAQGPNQVWMWDITWLPGPVKGLYYYLYLILDLYSRMIVGWEVHVEESAANASRLVKKAALAQGIGLNQTPLVLHSDNGSPMKGATLLETLYKLGITPSRSRPRVSNDNPYAESIFRTCKYRPSFPAKGFQDLFKARAWVLQFEHWYNYRHKHSGIAFLTPHQRHTGQADTILAKRRETYEKAKSLNPTRWSRHTRKWTIPEEVWLNPVSEKSSTAHPTIN
ncbi:IS3 family transposase [Anoxynatronum buryatiense]